MKRKNIHNKKGSVLADHGVEFAMAVIGLLICLYFAWAYLLHGAGDNLSQMQKCGAYTGGRGQCALSCDRNTEYTVQGAGCSKNEVCCVLIDENAQDVILQTPYGGSPTYDFSVLAISFDPNKPLTGCEYETTVSGQQDEKVIHCTPGHQYRISVAIAVESTGTDNPPLQISAVPVVVITGNADTIKPAGTFAGPVVDLGSGTPPTAEIVITNTEAKADNYIDIYPYVKCDTMRVCKSTDPMKRGILNRGPEDEYLTIKFVPLTTT